MAEFTFTIGPDGKFTGGTGYWTGKTRPPFSEEWKAKITANLRRPKSPPSPETRLKMSLAKKGKPSSVLGKHWTLSDETKAKFRLRTGPRSPAWLGGITPESKRIRETTQYKEWRAAVFARDNYTCVHCGASGCRIEADHIKPFSTYPQLRFDISNGRTLCNNCHRKTDTWGMSGKTRKELRNAKILGDQTAG